MNKILNEMEIKFEALSTNESFARATVASFCVQLNPSLDELTDIKTAVSEAITNSIVHAYQDKSKTNWVLVSVKLYKTNEVEITIRDYGVGIEDLEQAKQPFYTSNKTGERSGMGFTVMESFMDKLEVQNELDGGLSVKLYKKFKQVDREKLKQII